MGYFLLKLYTELTKQERYTEYMKKLTILFLFLLSVTSFSYAQVVPPTISVEGKAIPAVSFPDNPSTRTASARPGEQNGLSSTINAYAVKDITPCNNSKRSTTAPITRLWQHNVDMKERLDSSVMMFGMAPNEALTFRFVANYIGTGKVYLDMGNGEAGSPVVQFISISDKPCDFDVEVPTSSDKYYCYSSGGPSAVGAFFNIISKNAPKPTTPVCTLIEGNTYYMNIRFLDTRVKDGREKNDACEVDRLYWQQSERKCGGMIKFTGSVTSVSNTTNTTTSPVTPPQSTTGTGDFDPDTQTSTSNSSQCIQLVNNFRKGTRDAQVNNEVSLLQDFLSTSYQNKRPYLNIEPTGYFGSMTLTAVQAFQRDNGFSQTGYVGPLTREKIKDISCNGGVSSSNGLNNTSTNTQSSTNNSNTTQSTYTNPYTTQTNTQSTQTTYSGSTGGFVITSPFPGQSLNNTGECVGGTSCIVLPPIATIRWGRTSAPTVTIDLYNTAGSRVKTIASNTPNTGNYGWRHDPTLANGRYKIVIQADSQSAETGYFDIGGTGFTTNVSPTAPITRPVTTVTTNTSGFKPVDLDIYNQPINPTDKASITVDPEAQGREVSFTNLPNNAPLTRLYQTTIDPEKNGYIFRSMGLEPQQAVTYRLDIPEWMDGVMFRIWTNENTLGMDTHRMITISETRGDFDTSKLRTQSGSQLSGSNCYIEGLHTNAEFYTSKNGRIIYEYEEGGTLRNNISKTAFWPGQIEGLKKSACILVPGKTYYINVRFTVPTAAVATFSTPISSTEYKITDGCTLNIRLNNNAATKCGTLVQIMNDGKIDVLKQLATSGVQASTNANTGTNAGNFRAPDVALNGQTIQIENQQGTGSTVLNTVHGLAVSTVGAIATPPLSAIYQTAFDFEFASGYFMRPQLTLKPNEAFTVRTDIPLKYDGVIGTIETNDNSLGAVVPSTFISISETRGDFDTSKVLTYNPNTSTYTGNPCYRAGKIPVVTFYTSSTGEYPSSYENGVSPASMTSQTAFFTKNTQCRLIPGKTYYFNVRSQSPVDKPNEDSCAVTTAGWSNPVCGILVRIGYSPRIGTLNPVGTWAKTIGSTGGN